MALIFRNFYFGLNFPFDGLFRAVFGGRRPNASRVGARLGEDTHIQEAQLLLAWPTHGAKSIFATVMVINEDRRPMASLDASLTDETPIAIVISSP